MMSNTPMSPAHTAVSFSLRDKEVDAIEKMLNFNKPKDAKEVWDEPWKVLIYDSLCRDVISPLLRVGDLRKQGVTLHLSLHTERQPIPDVPAVYFVSPTEENVKRICEDLRNRLYDTYHFNFSCTIPRHLLEMLANSAIESDCVSQINKVFDQYLNFVCLEKNMFSLYQSNSFVGFNDPQLSDAQAEKNIGTTVDGLFSMLVTLGVVPIIRAPKNGAAEVVAAQLDTKIHDHIANVGNLFENSTTFQRPVLIILDRNSDLPTMLHHTWTYQALVHDLLSMNLNKVTVEVQESDDANANQTKKETKVFDLDSSSDSFWASNMDTPFPKIAVEVKSYINEYKTALDDFNKLSGGVDIDNYDESQILGKTKELGSFVNAIPMLREKKRIIDVHTNIATALLNEIKARELDTYFQYEEDMINKTHLEKKDILSVLTDSKRGTSDDKLRLFLIYYLTNDIPDIETFESALRTQGVDIAALRFLKKTKAFHQAMAPVLPTPSVSSPYMGSSLKSLMSKVPVDSMGFGGTLSQQLSTLFTAGVKALLPPTKELNVTRIVDAIMELKNDLGVDSYVYLDPRVQKKMRQTSIPRKNTPFKDGIVFIIGGGNYVEYQNVQDYAKKQPAKRIIYGSTEILSANQFVQQLTNLGGEEKKV